MCLIIHKPKGNSLEESVYKNGFDNNEDGAGFAYVQQDPNNPNRRVLRVEKGFMKFPKFYKRLQELGDEEMIIHFRRASPGMVVSEPMCHPFYVDTGDTQFETESRDKDRGI